MGRLLRFLDPKGLEAARVHSSAGENRAKIVDDSSGADARPSSRAERVASVAAALARAVLEGDLDRARMLPDELRHVEDAPTHVPLQLVR